MSVNGSEEIPQELFAGGGEMGALIRSHDWSHSALGAVEKWSESLKTAIGLVLGSPYPMFIWWGNEMINLYNDAYIPILGQRHPQALGESAFKVWADVWEVVGPQAEAVLKEGKSSWNKQALPIVERNGYPEERYFTFSYSPVPASDGRPGGVFGTVTEETERVLNDRRLRTLREGGAATVTALTVEAACEVWAAALTSNACDIPFALLYLLDRDRTCARLAGTTRLAAGTIASPEAIDLTSAETSQGWQLTQVMETGESKIVEDLQARFGLLPGGAWFQSPHQAVILPLARSGETFGFLIAGVSPLRIFDEDYKGFFDSIAGQVTTAICHARTYEQERKRVEALAELDRPNTVFLSNISDELRTPLTLIIGSTEDALTDRNVPLPAEHRERMEVVQRNGQRLLNLVNRLLDFWGMEAGADDYLTEPFSDGELLARVETNVEQAQRFEALQQEQVQQPEAETARQEVESILSSISDGFFVLDRNWHFTYVNDRLCSMLFKQREELLGYNHWDLFPNTVDTDVCVQLHRAMSSQTPVEFEYLYLRCNRWFQYRVFPSADGLKIFVTDIADRKQAQLVQAEQKRLLEFTASGHPLEECLSSLCASVSKLNPRTRACILVADAQGLTFPYSIAPDFGPSFAQGLKDAPINELAFGTCGEAVYSGKPVTCADIANDDRWSPRWRDLCLTHGVLACHSAPIQGADNLPLGSLILCFDEARRPTDLEYRLCDFATQVASIILDRDRSSLALRESEARLRRAMAIETVGVIFFQTDGTITATNDAFLRMSGYSREDTEQGLVRWDTMTPPEWMPHSLRAVEEFEATGRTNPYQKQYIRKDGSRWWALFAATQFNETEGVEFIIDITDRKQAEVELRESEVRFRQLADTAPVLIWMSGTDKLCNYFNQPWLDFTGRTIEQEMGNGWLEAVHPDDLQHCLDTYVTAFDARQQFQMEYRLRRFDGVYRWFLDTGIPRFTLEGDFLGYIGSCIDITDRFQAEVALRESESRLRLIIESAKDYAIFTLDPGGTIASWNSGAQRVLGYTDAEAIGCDGSIIFTPEDKEQGRAQTESEIALTQGKVENERWHMRKDGSRFWASGLMMPLQDETGNTQGFVNILQDKTAQRQANQRLHLLYEMTSDLLATEQPLALMNALFSKLSAQLDLHCYYNYLVEEKDNRPLLHLRNSSGISEEVAAMMEWIEFGEYMCGVVARDRRQIVLDREQIAAAPDARVIHSMGITAHAAQPLIARGRLLGTLSFGSLTRTCFTSEEIHLLQVTCDQVAIALERTNLTTSLQQQAEQLLQANRIKDEFLAVLSHELRSPLNPILGWSKLLQIRKFDEAKTAQALATIERNAKLQSELIEDLLDVSRILQGKLSLNPTAINLASTIRAALETVRLAAGAKSIGIEVSLHYNVGYVSGDSTRLQQVVWNLLSNAIKFTPAGGRVEVRLEQVGNQAQITISDNGQGIPQEFLPYVFDYFRQADSATTRKFGGLGLGLAIVRYLVELHGGTVQVQSPGEQLGATFTVRLPLMPIEPAVSQEEQSEEASLNLKGVQVLVVEDDTDTREFVVFLLQQAQASVIFADSAGSALAALMRSKPDVLLSDIGMPDMDGYMLMQQVRALPPEQGGEIPAIALTAYAGDFNQQQALDAGFQRHIAKPVEPEELIGAILNLVRRTH
ncbi:PAS domain S-box protein [Microcoleus sp. AR_TQ3_B6]|uniref:PAS domain S-box protein n=1 Tax=Microcoleus sp. AR_TQ3_B6 TaxID=3055284 RepID=UPI002FD64134